MNTTLDEKQAPLVDQEPVKLTKELMDRYREFLLKNGYKQKTIEMYFCYLNKLYAFLPGKKELTEDHLRRWVSTLKKDGYSDRTINLYISAANGLLRYCGQKKIPIAVVTMPGDARLPELSRKEYLQLLTYAQEHGSDREYLLIKTLATIDISLSHLPLLDAASCQRGRVVLPGHGEILIPDSIREELQAYVIRHGIEDGPVFISRSGQPLDRSAITHDIRRLGEAAGIEPEKSNPRALHRLYQKTVEEINDEFTSLQLQAYNRMLDMEQKTKDGLKTG